MFHIGQKVVCVNAIGNLCLKVGDVYTVQRYSPEAFPKSGPGVWLFEASGVHGGIPFYVWRFRPITERKTDISIFKRLLVPGSKIVETV